MPTPKDFKKNLNRNKLTGEMLGAAAYSANKRAKNYRNKAQEYYCQGVQNRDWGIYDKYSFPNAADARFKKQEFYKMKSKLLALLEPVCVHRVEFDECVNFFFLYEIGGYSFHCPIDEETALSSGLQIIEIDELYNDGEDINELVSVDFIKKVIALIESGNYTYEN